MSPAAPCRVLVARLSSLGDVVLALPVAVWLRRKFPAAHLSWLVDKGYEAVVEASAAVDRVVVYDYLDGHAGPAGVAALAGELGGVDLMIDLQNKVRTWMLAMHLQPAELIRQQLRDTFGLMRAMVGRDAILRAPHQVLRNLGLLKPFGWSGQPVAPRLRRMRCSDVEAMLRNHDGPLVGLAVGTRHVTKSWPVEYWTELAKSLQEAGCTVVLLGDGAHAGLLEQISARLRSRPVVYCRAGLGPLLALLGRCRVCVAPDTGPGHVAAALGVPVVSLFGPTSPERWAPFGGCVKVVRVPLPCSPCSNHGRGGCPLGTHECMTRMTPGLVRDAVKSLVGL